MKQFMVLLLCAAMIQGITGYDFKSGATEQHRMHKRQLDSDETRRCQSVVTSLQCSDGLYQEAANIAMSCNQPLEVAQDLQENCLTNSNGMHCGLAITYLERVQSIPTVCENASILCTTECRDLLTDIRNELGCCISETYNQSTDGTASLTDSFSFSLWSSCGLAPVDGCPANSDFELQATPVDPSCTPSDYLERLGANSCARRFLDPILDELSTTNNCQHFGQIYREQCQGVSETGRPCYELQIPLVDGFVLASTNCANTTICDASCRTALQSLADMGCCVNNAFNGTAAEVFGLYHDFLSNEFWSLCGLETTGLCELNSATALYKVTTVTAALLLLSVYLIF